MSRFSRRLTLTLLMLALATSLSIAAPAPQAQPARQSFNPATGFATFIGYSAQNPLRSDPLRSAILTPLELALETADQFAPLFGVDGQAGGSQLTLLDGLTESEQVAGGKLTARFGQTYQGVPVFGAQMLVNQTRDGAILSINGKLSPNLNLSTIPAVNADAAVATANLRISRLSGLPDAVLENDATILNIYDSGLHVRGGASQPRLAWLVETHAANGAPLRQVTLIDAQTGDVLLSYNAVHADVFAGSDQARSAREIFAPWVNIGPQALPMPAERGTRVLGSPDMSTHTLNGGTVLPGTFLCNESAEPCTSGGGLDVDANNAHTFARGTYEFYEDNHSRDSLNDNGMQLISSVHYSSNYCNAFWDGSQMAYGDGCNIVLDDVVAHELTHGVTEFTSNLIYEYESGAINEAFSDIWGELYDLDNATAEDIAANRWVIGEEIQAGGFRNMKTPGVWGDPDRLNSPIFWVDYADQGGVHINSGIANKATYLMVDGDTFNGFTVTGIGATKTLAVWYLAQTTLLTTLSDYNDLYDAALQACSDLIGGAAGITAGDCTEVTEALQATEMNLTSPFAPKVTDLCAAGTPTFLYQENFETGSDGWTTLALAGSNNVWTLNSSSAPLDGGFSMFGANLAAIRDVTAAMTTNVALPADKTAYLHFWHSYEFETGGWDGGVIEYSTNNGVNWTRLTNSRVDAGEGYVDSLVSAINGNNNPLAGSAAFGGKSFGVNKERWTLASFSGQNIRFRFRLGSDSFAGAPGWKVDNINVYTCDVGSTPTAPSDLSAVLNGTNVNLSWTDTATDDDSVTITRSDGVSTFDLATVSNDATSYTDFTAACGTIYTYQLRLTNGFGDTLSNTDQVTMQDCGTALLLNGDFEIAGATSKLAASWTLLNPTAGDQRICKPGNGLGDSCAFRLKGGAGKLSSVKQVVDESLVAVGDELTLEAWIRGGGLTTPAKVQVIIKSAGPKQKITLTTPSGGSAYAKYTQIAEVLNTPTKLFVKLIYTGTGGKALFDDVSLSVITPGPRGVFALPAPVVPEGFRGGN